ncbi:cation:proton antiporter, partial [Halorubrum sp. SS5]
MADGDPPAGQVTDCDAPADAATDATAESASAGAVIVPVEPSSTLRSTVAHVAEAAAADG